MKDRFTLVFTASVWCHGRIWQQETLEFNV
jgi:hypothetical protein